jgi:hypothetical protein
MNVVIPANLLARPALADLDAPAQDVRVPGVALGQAANLLLGLRPQWKNAETLGLPFFPPEIDALPTQQVVITPSPSAFWSFPSISLHDDLDSLLGDVLSIQIAPVLGDQGALSLPTGTLATDQLDREAVLGRLSTQLGIDLTREYSFMLVQLVRQVGEASHRYVAGSGGAETDHLTPRAQAIVNALPGVTALRPDMPTTLGEATAILGCFGTIGTHFVSAVTAGDRIFQVFAYERDTTFEAIKAAFNKSTRGAATLSGIEAISFRYYTTPRGNDTGLDLGYVRARGSLCIASNDPAFARSLKAGEWHQKRAGGDSIFAAYDEAAQDSKVQLEQFVQVVPISVTLTPIGNLVPVEKSTYARWLWTTILKGALLQKHGTRMRMTFPEARPFSWSDWLPQSGGWLSTIMTPSVNVYDTHVALPSVRLTNRAVVKNFTSWSIVLEGGTNVTEIPGGNVAMAAFLIDASGDGQPPILQLDNKAAVDSLTLLCDQMFGALVIQDKAKQIRRTAVSGIVLETTPATGDTGRASVRASRDMYGVRSTDWLSRQIDNLNFALTSCQTLLYGRGGDDKSARMLARAALSWLAELIPNREDVADDLLAFRTRAAYLAHIAGRLQEDGVPVPYLTYSAYENYINALTGAASSLDSAIQSYQAQIAIQTAREQAAKTAEEVNRNIKTTGQLLSSYIGAVAKNQDDIAGSYDSIIQVKQRDLDSAIKSLATISKSVDDQQIAVENAKLEFQQAMVKFEETEIIKFCLNVAVGLITIGFAFAIPSSSINAVKDLGETAQKIQKLANVLKALMDFEKTLESFGRSMVALNKTLDDLQKVSLDLPTSRQWNEMALNFDAALAGAPSEVGGQKAKLVAAFKIMVLRVQDLLTTQAKIATFRAEIALNTAQQKINADHRARLQKLTANLHLGDELTPPNVSEIDLIGLCGQLQSRLNQCLSALSQALVLQDSAVVYELLSPPTPIRGFDLTTLRLTMASQQGAILKAKTKFNPPPTKHDPIQISIKGVPIWALTRGNIYSFELQPSMSEFQPYNMVRVQKVTADITNIKTSASGRYIVTLSCLGNPFQDRDELGVPLTYNTITRKFGPFEYNVFTKKLLSGEDTGEIGSEITKITPFSTWQVALPNDANINLDLDFGGEVTVDIVLTFWVETLFSVSMRRMLRARGINVAMATHADMVSLLRESPLAVADAARPAATLDDMLTQMSQAQGVLKGWDCVLNLLEDPVNKFIAAQFAERYPTSKPMVVDVGFGQSLPLQRTKSLLSYTKISVTLGPPLMQFQANNHDYVAVTQTIQTAEIRRGSRVVDQAKAAVPHPVDFDNPDITWDDPTTIDVAGKPTVRGAVALGTVQGLVEPPLPDGSKGKASDTHSVVLDFAKGSFTVRDLNIDTNNADLNLQLSNWFTASEIKYLINTVVFNDVSTLKALQPVSFKLNVLTTNSGKDILQVFITTTGEQKNNLTINVNEPIPDGFHNSLMINTKIMFQDIFVESFNKGSTNVTVAQVKPPNDFTAWGAKVSSGTVSGEVQFENTTRRQTRIREGSNVVSWELNGLQFNPTKDQGVSLTYTAEKDVPFQTRVYISNPRGYSGWSNWRDHNCHVKVTLNGNYALQVDTKANTVKIASTPPMVRLTGPDLQPTGPCECNDNDLRLRVGQLLRQQVPDKLRDAMGGIQFKPVSVFALYNLLFPAGDFIVMKDAYVPGDLVVLGSFSKYVPPPT